MLRRSQVLVLAVILVVAAFSTGYPFLFFLLYVGLLVGGGSYILTRLGQLEAKIERQEKLYKDQIRQLKDDIEDVKATRPHKGSSRNLSENKDSQSVERLDGLRRM